MASEHIYTRLWRLSLKTAKVKKIVKAGHWGSWDNYIASIEHDVHGHQLNAYKILEHPNTAKKYLLI